MYQTKLVLWRLLQNKSLFKNLRIGMATTFLSLGNAEAGTYAATHAGILAPRQDKNGIFKVAPFGSNIWTVSFFDKDGNNYANLPPQSNVNALLADPNKNRVNYNNGVMYGPITGELEALSAVHGQYYPLWNNLKVQSTYATVNSDNTEPDGWWSEAWDNASGRHNNPSDYPRAGETYDRPLYKLMNRASLWLPIREYDDKWTKGGVTISHADKFRMWINGVADIKSAGVTGTTGYDIAAQGLMTRLREGFGDNRKNQFHYYKDPEIGIAGLFALPQAIFPDPTVNSPKTNKPLQLDRDYMHNNGFVWYSKKDRDINYMFDFRRFSSELDIAGFPKAMFNAGSGEAAGSVIDFFSPRLDYSFTGTDTALTGYYHAGGYGSVLPTGLAAPAHQPFVINGHRYGRSDIYDSAGKSTIAAADLDDVSFPIKNTCEDNWLIVVASGTEAKTGPGEYSYSTAEAIKNLYDYTDKNNPKHKPVTMLVNKEGGGRELREADLDHPIRTLVIGIVAREDDPDVQGDPIVLAEVREMRRNLIRMARAGQGDDPDNEDSAHTPFFADDVESLMRGFEEALTLIESHQNQPSKSAIVESRAMDDLETGEEFNYYASEFRIRRDDQWEGYLTRFAVREVTDPITDKLNVDVTKMWELNSKITAARNTGNPRKLKYWNGSELADITSLESLKGLAGLTEERLDYEHMPGFADYSPDRAMFDWLNGSDHSYEKSDKGPVTNYPRFSMLADIGQGGISFVDDPISTDSLPGYSEWAGSLTPQDPLIYVHTNDGILHIVDPKDGTEESAILPPPLLIPSRLASLKTWRRINGKLQWIDVIAPESESSNDIIRPRSTPAYILDGALQKRDFSNSAGTSWKTMMLAGLGRGGSGLYMLDINDANRDNPKLMWYRERIGNYLWEMLPDDAMPKVAEYQDPYFLRLGFNSPKAVMGVTGDVGGVTPNMTNFIALAGGLQNDVDLSRNGDEGAVLLILDPETGELIRGFGVSDIEGAAAGSKEKGPYPAMGMMTSDPTLLRTAQTGAYSPYLAGSIYAADNRGNIFNVALENTDSSGVVTPLAPDSWKIRTVATLHPSVDNAKESLACYAIPYGVQLSIVYGRIWLTGGTADLKVKINDTYPTGVLSNESQMIFAFRTAREQEEVYSAGDLKPLVGSNDVFGDSDLAAGKHGWKIDLLPKTATLGAEYVSAKPLVTNGVVYIPTFMEEKVVWTDDQICEAGSRISGDSRLYVMDVASGRAKWPSGKFALLNGAKITSITLSTRGKKRRIVVTYDKLTDADFDDGSLAGAQGAQHVKEMSSFFFDEFGGGSGVNLENNQNVIQYWLQK
jgi:Tfp pilus tip-associated adhesin PilY1